MRFIGITGGVGAGKTEILKYIGRHYKCEIYLADEIGQIDLTFIMPSDIF